MLRVEINKRFLQNFFCLFTSMAAMPLLTESLGIGCKPSICPSVCASVGRPKSYLNSHSDGLRRTNGRFVRPGEMELAEKERRLVGNLPGN